MHGFIHSIETFGTVDGPGIRYVVFLQGCPMRCQYCHNPDTWEVNQGKKMTVNQILDDYQRYLPYLRNGGLTVTGGEPLLQIDFLIELFEQAKSQNIHTCIDTSGITFQRSNSTYMEKLDRLLQSTDLILLDIKHINAEEHLHLTGHTNEGILDFAKYLDQKKIPVWIRHVVVPTITDNKDYLYELGHFIGGLTNVKALDVLPYHNLGISKYRELGMEYPLKDLPPLDTSDAVKAREIIIQGIKDKRKALREKICF
jgi:pyruvate formate-lyase 1-activating enzyme